MSILKQTFSVNDMNARYPHHKFLETDGGYVVLQRVHLATATVPSSFRYVAVQAGLTEKGIRFEVPNDGPYEPTRNRYPEQGWLTLFDITVHILNDYKLEPHWNYITLHRLFSDLAQDVLDAQGMEI